jgi:hypothetical protein
MNQENQDFMPEIGGNQSQDNTQSGQSDIKAKLEQLLEKFREFPPKIQFAIIGGTVFVLYVVFAGGGSEPPVQPQAVVKQPDYKTGTTSARAINSVGGGEDEFSLMDPERGSLQKGFFEQQQRIIGDRLDAMEVKVDEKMSEVQEIQQSIAKQAKQLNQMVENFNEQMKSMEKVNQGSLEEIRKLAEESKNRNLQSFDPQTGAPVPGAAGVQPGATQQPQNGRNKPIKQIILQQDSSNATAGDPLLGGLVNKGDSVKTIQDQIQSDFEEAVPFVPPLGFVRGTLINGFDALAGAGTPSPALIRLSGTYKTAMNSTVNLNGCFMLAEFEGDLSTERAFGTPARMTCVYPDQGAVTYDVAGYVVDEKDGIVGIPGIFYEGDPSRIAAAMIADFTAAIADVIQQNQSTQTTSAEGVEQSTLTGSETRAEIAGGVSNAVGSLRDYLAERANRIVPFVRVDATRDLHIVILEGVELRHQGKPWTLLVSGTKKDEIATKRAQQLERLRRAERDQNTRRR